MLLVNGINVYPREVEEIIYQFPGVREASVIGVPDARKGEQPLAYVAANDGDGHWDEKALLQFVRSKLADYKTPRRVSFSLPALPRNATGKILENGVARDGGEAKCLNTQTPKHPSTYTQAIPSTQAPKNSKFQNDPKC